MFTTKTKGMKLGSGGILSGSMKSNTIPAHTSSHVVLPSHSKSSSTSSVSISFPKQHKDTLSKNTLGSGGSALGSKSKGSLSSSKGLLSNKSKTVLPQHGNKANLLAGKSKPQEVEPTVSPQVMIQKDVEELSDANLIKALDNAIAFNKQFEDIKDANNQPIVRLVADKLRRGLHLKRNEKQVLDEFVETKQNEAENKADADEDGDEEDEETMLTGDDDDDDDDDDFEDAKESIEQEEPKHDLKQIQAWLGVPAIIVGGFAYSINKILSLQEFNFAKHFFDFSQSAIPGRDIVKYFKQFSVSQAISDAKTSISTALSAAKDIAASPSIDNQSKSYVFENLNKIPENWKYAWNNASEKIRDYVAPIFASQVYQSGTKYAEFVWNNAVALSVIGNTVMNGPSVGLTLSAYYFGLNALGIPASLIPVVLSHPKLRKRFVDPVAGILGYIGDIMGKPVKRITRNWAKKHLPELILSDSMIKEIKEEKRSKQKDEELQLEKKRQDIDGQRLDYMDKDFELRESEAKIRREALKHAKKRANISKPSVPLSKPSVPLQPAPKFSPLSPIVSPRTLAFNSSAKKTEDEDKHGPPSDEKHMDSKHSNNVYSLVFEGGVFKERKDVYDVLLKNGQPMPRSGKSGFIVDGKYFPTFEAVKKIAGMKTNKSVDKFIPLKEMNQVVQRGSFKIVRLPPYSST